MKVMIRRQTEAKKAGNAKRKIADKEEKRARAEARSKEGKAGTEK